VHNKCEIIPLFRVENGFFFRRFDPSEIRLLKTNNSSKRLKNTSKLGGGVQQVVICNIVQCIAQ